MKRPFYLWAERFNSTITFNLVREKLTLASSFLSSCYDDGSKQHYYFMLIKNFECEKEEKYTMNTK